MTLNLALWIVTGVLAVAYLLSGAFKLILTREKIAAFRGGGGGWAMDFSDGTVKAIGVFEVLAAVGLVLPAVLGIAPILVPLAALGLAIIMVGAVFTRIRRHEIRLMVVDLVYLALIGFVAWGRFGPVPISG